MGNDCLIELKNIDVSFDGEQVLHDLNLTIRDGEFVTLLGPSGCGKTTTLRLIGGFLQPDRGDVLFAGKRVNEIPPHKRQVNTIFQKYALFPHLNVFENVAFGMRIKKKPKAEIQKKTEEMLELVNLKQHKNHLPNQMSGGQQQRVGVARALVVDPGIIFADEPTGNLDSHTSEEVMRLMQRVVKEQKRTLVMVTHDNHLASYADRVFHIMDGKILKIEDRRENE